MMKKTIEKMTPSDEDFSDWYDSDEIRERLLKKQQDWALSKLRKDKEARYVEDDTDLSQERRQVMPRMGRGSHRIQDVED